MPYILLNVGKLQQGVDGGFYSYIRGGGGAKLLIGYDILSRMVST
jgi:hypothetical protein